MKLSDVIKAYLSPDKETSLDNALGKVGDLKELTEETKARTAELAAIDAAELTEEQVAELETCSEILMAINTRQQAQAAKEADTAARIERAEAAKASVSDLAAKHAEPSTPPPPPPAPEAAKEDPKTEAPEAVAPVVEVEKSPDVNVDATVTPAVPVLEGELVAAGVGADVQPFRQVSQLPGEAPPAVTSRAMSGKLTTTFAVDPSGTPTGRQFSSLAELGNVMVDAFRAAAYGGHGYNRVAQFRRNDLDDFKVIGRDTDLAVVEEIVSRGPVWDRAKGQFAAGWCAPSENLYQLCPDLTSLQGLVDLPELIADRGGVNTTSGPDIADFFASAAIGQVLTEAQVIAGTPKTCIEVDCPDFTETRLDVNPLCITGNLLTLAGYPEYVARFLSLAVKANIHDINGTIIARMVAASTAVDTRTATLGAADTSTVSEFLDYVTLYAVWLRERYRTALDQVIEVVVPHWLMQSMAADLTRRNGVDLLVNEARIRAAFAERNIRVQWVYDWQTLPATPALLNTTRPIAAQVLVYIPGTFVKLTAPVINLGTVHSAAQLTLNQYTAMFVEEGFNVLERCFQSLVLTVDACPSGMTGAASVTCDSTP